MKEPFTIIHSYSDGSGKPIVVYVGSDKAAAFEALWKFLMDDPSQGSSGLARYSSPTAYMTSNRPGGE